MRRRIVWNLAAVIVLGAALYSAYWFFAADELRRGIDRWAEDRRRAGWTVSWESVSVGGFPLSLKTTIIAPRLAVPIRWDWRGPDFTVTAPPWNPGEIAAVFPGEHRIAILTGGESREFRLLAREALGRASISGGRLREVSARLVETELKQVEIGPPGTMTADAVVLRLAVSALQAEPSGGATGPVIGVALSGLMLPETARPALGRAIRTVDADFELPGGLPHGIPGGLARWRDDGGTLEIRRLRLVWGGLRFDGDGTMALDSELQPVGAMRARIGGYRATVDALARAGLVRGRDAPTVKLVLGLVARVTPGGDDTITVPITLQDRRLSVGPARLLVVPRIEWK